jgi:chromosome segregation ATPase
VHIEVKDEQIANYQKSVLELSEKLHEVEIAERKNLSIAASHQEATEQLKIKQGELELLQTDLMTKDEEISSLIDRTTKLESEITHLEEEKSSLQKKLSKKKTEIVTMTKNTILFEEECADNVKKLKQQLEIYREFEKKSSELTEAKSLIETQHQHLISENQDLKLELENLKQIYGELNQRTGEKINEIEKKLLCEQEEGLRLKQKLEDMISECESAQQKHQELEVAIIDNDEIIRRL